MNILLIDDDPVYCDQLRNRMSHFCKVRSFSNSVDPLCEEAVEEAFASDAILIDLKMSRMDGISLFKKLQDKGGVLPPVLILTENESKDFRLMAFREGVDDFVNKDSSEEELFLRIKKALDNSKTHASSFSGLVLNHGDMSCQLEGKSVELTRIEFQILKILLCAIDHKVLKPDLVNKIWKHKKVSAHTLNTHVYNLNSKLKKWERMISIGTTGVVHITLKS
ncbi:response regulator transcription factor [bacterium]|nr:response regulator transcription factor [bacterium]